MHKPPTVMFITLAGTALHHRGIHAFCFSHSGLIRSRLVIGSTQSFIWRSVPVSVISCNTCSTLYHGINNAKTDNSDHSMCETYVSAEVYATHLSWDRWGRLKFNSIPSCISLFPMAESCCGSHVLNVVIPRGTVRAYFSHIVGLKISFPLIFTAFKCYRIWDWMIVDVNNRMILLENVWLLKFNVRK